MPIWHTPATTVASASPITQLLWWRQAIPPRGDVYDDEQCEDDPIEQ